MACTEVMTAYIKKLGHPLKEIRERALQLLVAKLQLGWKLEDELSGTRELLEALLVWFQVDQPPLQKQALHLLHSTIKTKAGSYILREFGVKKFILTLNKAKHKIEADAIEIYNDVLDTLRFVNAVESSDSVTVPPLTLDSLACSESEYGSCGDYYDNLGLRCNQPSSKETSLSQNEPIFANNRENFEKSSDGIRVLLFPWVALCSSDSKTILMVQDALKLLKSTRRCLRFICDVFLQDFPAEIFLNRPGIIQVLLTMSQSLQYGRPTNALNVLLCITRALRTRLRQLSCPDLIHQNNQISFESKGSVEDLHAQLDLNSGVSVPIPDQDDLAALKQLPAPIYALDTAATVLTIMVGNIAVTGPDILDWKELNTCLNLLECLIQLLFDCVSEEFWRVEHNTKTLRDIAHKSCTVMRMLGDILNKYRESFIAEPSRVRERATWLRAAGAGARLVRWARHSALPPASLVATLHHAILDPALPLIYPALSQELLKAIEHSKISVDNEFKSKYRELSKLYASMEEAARFMSNKNTFKNTKNVLTCINNSLPALELLLNETYLSEVSDILLKRLKDFELSDSMWSDARGIALKLMAHRVEWVQTKFYRLLADMVRAVLVADDADQEDNEKSLTLLFDVGILTEICCHGLSSKFKEVEMCASDIMLYLVRGRLVVSDACWWRLLASLLPVLPLLHVYAAHDTQLGKAICKSLEPDIAECMGVSMAEVSMGLVRLLFVRCPAVRMDAADALCRILDDEKYLPPRESLRIDCLLSALSGVEPQDFNVDNDGSPSKATTTGLLQILDVLKQDLVLDMGEGEGEVVARTGGRPALEPALRRSALQQLALVLRHHHLHDAFLNYDGLRVVVALLRMSMQTDDYLAFPECALSCVSALNSVSFTARHALAKIPQLPHLLLRVILVFPADEVAVRLSAQVLALAAWAGFALQELSAARRRVPALPHCVVARTRLPFEANTYWNTSPNVDHSSVEWVLSDASVRAALRVRWWCVWEGVSRVLHGAPPPPAPLALRPTASDLATLRATCPSYSCTKALLELENATSHKQVNDALCLLESYLSLWRVWAGPEGAGGAGGLPWRHTRRFVCAPPASSRDTALLVALLALALFYMDAVATQDGDISWIEESLMGDDVSLLSLLSREELYLEQTPQESIEVTQLHIHIVKVLCRCVIALNARDDYDKNKMESLLKILLSCLQRVDLRNFHKLGYLNELVRCIRHVVWSRHCQLSEELSVECMGRMCGTLAGSAAGGGRKGQACRLDALLTLLALLQRVHNTRVPVQRWSECWGGDVIGVVARCVRGARAELRAAALRVMAALAHHAQFMPHLLQAVSCESLAQYAASVFAESGEAHTTRCAAAGLLTALASRASPHVDVSTLHPQNI